MRGGTLRGESMSTVSRRTFFGLTAAGAALAGGRAVADKPAVSGLASLTRDAQPISAAEHGARRTGIRRLPQRAAADRPHRAESHAVDGPLAGDRKRSGCRRVRRGLVHARGASAVPGSGRRSGASAVRLVGDHAGLLRCVTRWRCGT